MFRAESIKWFREDQAFSPSCDLAPPPPHPLTLSAASCLSFSVFMCVACQAFWRGGGGGAKSYDGEKAWVSKTNF